MISRSIHHSGILVSWVILCLLAILVFVVIREVFA